MSDEAVILGLNSAYHESSACIVRGGQVLAIAEEERFNRRKHGKAAGVDNADEIPTASILDCIHRAGIDPSDIDYVAYSFDPSLRRRFVAEPTVAGGWGSPEGEEAFLASVARVPAAVGEVLGRDVSDRWIWVGHELAHAASAYFASPFEEAAILCVDGIGEHSTGLLAHGQGNEIDVMSTFEYPNSLGFVWETISKFVGLDEYSAPKVMALAAFGRPDRYRDDFERILSHDPTGFEVDIDAFRFRVEDYGPLEARFGPRRRPGEHVDWRDAGVAAALQSTTETVLSSLANRLEELTGSTNLCVAGGVALNCVAMGRILNEGPFEGVYVQPLAHDAGTALGAALWVAHTRGGAAGRYVMADACLGPAYDDAAVDAALAGADAAVEATRVPDPAAAAAAAIDEGLLVGWFQGASEVGPRALGNRSILADPRRAATKELLNLRVKHREYFRPFAPSGLEEHAREWFDVARASLSTGFMSFAVDVRPEKRALVPAILHVDGTARLQTVSEAVNPRYHALISEFHRRTGVPLVLNTSFNTFDEPIVCSPEDALRTFLRTDLDVLVLHDRVVRKRAPARAEAAAGVQAGRRVALATGR